MRKLVLVPIVLMLVGCVSTNAAVLNPSASYQKICADGVQIFTTADRVPGDYQEVAMLHSKGESSWTDERQMLNSQRKKAAGLGANGIIVGATSEPKAGTKIIGSLLGTGAERKGAAIAIFIPSDSARVRRACGGGGATQTVAQEATQPYGSTSTAQRPAETAKPESAASAPVADATTRTEVPGTAAAPAVPPGTRFIGDNVTKRYYSIDCPIIDCILGVNRFFFRSEGGAQAGGYVLGTDCNSTNR
jgi:hypothetical protein